MTTSFIAACGSGRSTSFIPAVPAAWSVTTIAFMIIFSELQRPRFSNCSVRGRGLTSDTSASTTFAVGPAGAPPLIYASAATAAATSETATARPTVLGDFMGGFFAARARHGGSAQKKDVVVGDGLPGQARQ